VGYPLEGIELQIIPITDQPVASMDDVKSLGKNQVGEITVKGAIVNESYWANPAANNMTKVRDKTGEGVWHRTGDLGRRDQEGRLWFYGRKSQRVVSMGKTYFTIPVEAVFNQHPEVSRTALVGVKKDKGTDIVPVICVEGAKNKKRKIYLQNDLRSLASDHDHTKEIRDFLFCREFPVDPRHNAKIYREKLSSWANMKLSL